MALNQSIETILAHAGLGSDPKTGAISTPIYQTATFGHPALGESTGFDYSRTSNPTRLVLEKIMAELECGFGAYAFSSGMAAITAILQLFKPGEKIIVSDDLYGGTYRVFDKIFRNWGLEFEQFDFSDKSGLTKNITGNTKALFIETPTNPLMKIADLYSLISFAKSKGILVIVDNTFMTPYCQRPLELGADIVVHSGTKFLSGHNDTLCGIVVAAEKTIAEKIAFIQNSTGGILSPFDSWLTLRGLKTLAVRMDQAQKSALSIAKYLSVNGKITHVYYPGLKTHPDMKIHFRQSSGAGALISFRTKNKSTAKRIINNVKVITFAESLGGVESLITYPITQTHADMPEEIKKKIGITDDLLRLSVGIENCKDLINDLEKAIG
jgi:cystathionine gamma-synthase